MQLHTPITILDSAYAPDGGSRQLRVRDADGAEHQLILVQHAFPQHDADDPIPGRLYWDGEIIDIRSPEESVLLDALKSPAVDYRPSAEAGPSDEAGEEDEALSIEEIEADILECATEIRTFVSSDEYLHVAGHPPAQ